MSRLLSKCLHQSWGCKTMNRKPCPWQCGVPEVILRRLEDVSVSVRWQSLVVVLACGLAGCGGSAADMRFVENTAVAKPVHRKAREVVRKTLEENFGTPLNSVAWLKLPVKYGRAEGTIKAVDDHTLSFELNAETSDLTGFDSPEFAHSVMLLTSGTNSGKTISLASFDGQAKAFEADSFESAPTAEDQFVVAGHQLRHGRKLYARHCQHCHGVSGDGAGSTAKYLNPRPRDYRLGVFKFTSTKTGAKATRDDLRRVVGQGIPGTYMPAFVPMLKDQELTAIVEYVRWLAMRGEIERQLLTDLRTNYAADRAKREAQEPVDQAKSSVEQAKKAVEQASKDKEKKDVLDRAKKELAQAEKELDRAKREVGKKATEVEKQIDTQLNDFLKNSGDESFAALLKEVSDDLVEKWLVIEEEGAAVIPSLPRVADEESRARGKKLFFGNDAKCVDCHGAVGRGNGAQTEAFLEHPITKEKYLVPGLHDDWGQPIKPRDLTRGIYRGGRRPIDIYRRVSEGIKGTPMPGGGKSLKSDQIWDLVNYVLSIPFESPKTAKTHVASQPHEPGHAN